MKKVGGSTMNKYLSVVEFSNSFCFQITIDGHHYPFTFREFEPEKAIAKAKMLGEQLALPVYGWDGFPIGETNAT